MDLQQGRSFCLHIVPLSNGDVYVFLSYRADSEREGVVSAIVTETIPRYQNFLSKINMFRLGCPAAWGVFMLHVLQIIPFDFKRFFLSVGKSARQGPRTVSRDAFISRNPLRPTFTPS